MRRNLASIRLGQYLTLGEFCTCTQTYQRFREQINPYPANLEASIPAMQALCEVLIDPIIDQFGREPFILTYGFCSKDLKRFLAQRDPESGQKYGRVDPSRDQHMAMEKNRKGNYFCDRLGAACDFLIKGERSDGVVDWILAEQLPFDSLYFYGKGRPIHISHGPQRKKAIWGFTDKGTPTRKGLEHWLAQLI
ncbi:MAG: hypothetical protein AAGG51_02855 [Cyanobacteria bacterium P01_G01_bin.54]